MPKSGTWRTQESRIGAAPGTGARATALAVAAPPARHLEHPGPGIKKGGLPQAQELGQQLLLSRPLQQRLEAPEEEETWCREEGVGMWSGPGTQGQGPGAQEEALGEEEKELEEEEE